MAYQVIGDIILKKGCKKEEAQELMKKHPRIKTVCSMEGVDGELRKPKVRKIAGNGTVTIHKEHGILYKLDVAKQMFSKGNLSERKRLIEQVKNEESIVDMFAGIGYFSLGIAKKDVKILAIEKNPESFAFLRENIVLNKLSNIEAVNADNRSIEIKKKADRVIMGYLPKTERYLPAALEMIKNGGIIHFHNTYAKKELWTIPVEQIKKACENHECSFDIINKKKVKSFAPNVFHVVMDIKIDF